MMSCILAFRIEIIVNAFEKNGILIVCHYTDHRVALTADAEWMNFHQIIGVEIKLIR